MFELLIVMAIISILATLGIPAIRGLAQPNTMSAASRQLLDDLSLARMMAISQRTTVYVAFAAPTIYDHDKFLTDPRQKKVLNNLMAGQFRAYALVSLRSVGDQPGQNRPRYLTDWRYLPEGVLIPATKYPVVNGPKFQMAVPLSSGQVLPIQVFSSVALPFPNIDCPVLSLPCLAFNAQGQLETLDRSFRADEYIPLARGSIMAARNPDGQYALTAADVREIPPGNSTNTYNLIQVSWLTGRAKVVRKEAQ